MRGFIRMTLHNTKDLVLIRVSAIHAVHVAKPSGNGTFVATGKAVYHVAQSMDQVTQILDLEQQVAQRLEQAAENLKKMDQSPDLEQVAQSLAEVVQRLDQVLAERGEANG